MTNQRSSQVQRSSEITSSRLRSSTVNKTLAEGEESMSESFDPNGDGDPDEESKSEMYRQTKGGKEENKYDDYSESEFSESSGAIGPEDIEIQE